MSWMNEYPRPQMKRDSFFSLNGGWQMDGKKIKATIDPETVKKVSVYTAIMPGNPADHPLHAILLRVTGDDVTIKARYEFE